MKKLSVIVLMLLCVAMLLCSCDKAGVGTDDTTEGTTAAPAPAPAPVVPAPEDELVLRYDDRYTFDAEIDSIETLAVISKSATTGEADTAVLTLAEGTANKVIATGTGTSCVTFKDGTELLVTVEPAPISLIYLFGQSNAEGMITSNADDCALARSQSVLLQEGQVYSTYAPNLVARKVGEGSVNDGANLGGVPFDKALLVDTANSFVAKSLTSTQNIMGENLIYPLNNLTRADGGKSGLDSSLAYQWNKETGDKVWVINVAHSGSEVDSWNPDSEKYKVNNNFWEAAGVVKGCLAVLKNEINAGHYTYSRSGYFWVQGCAEEISKKNMTAKEYSDAFMKMHNGFTAELATDLDGDGENETLDFGAIIEVLNPISSTTALDLRLSGPRAAQYYMGTTTDEAYKNVYLASNLGDLFVSDPSAVEKYFAEKYPDGKINFPTRVYYPLPTTIAEVHPDIHYRQPGYNALGMDAVSNLLKQLNGEKMDASDIHVYQDNGFAEYKDGDTVILTPGKNQAIVASAGAGEFQSKGIEMVLENCTGVTLENNFLIPAAGATVTNGTLTVKYNGETVMTLNVKTK